MEIEIELEILKHKYRGIEPSEWFARHGFADLKLRILAEEKKRRPLLGLWQGIALAGILVLFLGSGLVGAAQGTKPGDTLYPVKILSEKVYWKAFPEQNVAVDRRAKEVIDLARENSANLAEAKAQYQKTVEEASSRAKERGMRDQLNKNLEKHENQFKQIIDENPSVRGDLEELIDTTKKGRGEVKGQKDK